MAASAQAPVFEWARHIKAVLANKERIAGMVSDKHGCQYVTGIFGGTLDFDPGPGVYNLTCATANEDVFVAKYDSAGKFIWAKQFAGTGLYGAVAMAITADTLGNIYTTGNFPSTVDFDPGPAVYNLSASGEMDIYVSKLDSFGNFQWARQFAGTGTQSGGTGTAIAIDAGGDVLVGGEFTRTFDFDPGPGVYNFTVTLPAISDVFLVKLTKSGAFSWAKQFASAFTINCKGLATDGEGKILVTGEFITGADFDPGPGNQYISTISNAHPDVFICKLTPSGDLEWVKTLGAQHCAALGIDANNDIVVTGYFGGPVDFDPGAGVYSLNGADEAGFVLKLKKNGDFSWAKAFYGTTTTANLPRVKPAAVAIDAAGNIYTTGSFLGAIDLDPGPAVYSFNSLYTLQFYTSKLNPSGDFVWGMRVESSNYAYTTAITMDAHKNVYLGGVFGSLIYFNPGPSPVTFNGGFEAIFLNKMSQCSNISYNAMTATACNSYTLNGQTYTATGVYTQTLENAQGCDSVITLNLTINGSTSTATVETCDSYTWETQTFTSSGFYSITYIGSTGCDSILNLDLTLHYSTTTAVNASICEGQAYAGHTSSGTYTDHYSTVHGCDSARTLNLVVKPRSFSSHVASICEGKSYWGHTGAGIYMDTLVAANGCDSIRTLNLSVNPRALITKNASICQGGSYFAGGALQTTSGIYQDVFLTWLGCDSIITTNLTVLAAPVPDLGPDRNICSNSSTAVSPGAFSTYTWQNNSTAASYNINAPGKYWVTVTGANNCPATDTLVIFGVNPVPQNFLPADKELCYGNTLNIAVPGYKNYLWSTNAITSNISVRNFGKYYLTVTDHNNCTGVDSIEIKRANCIPISIPNAFTPDGNGINDVFKPTILQEINRYNMIVYNRYGQKVFESAQYGKGWNGTWQGKEQPAGSYVYQVSFTNAFGYTYNQNGSVLLIR